MNVTPADFERIMSMLAATDHACPSSLAVMCVDDRDIKWWLNQIVDVIAEGIISIDDESSHPTIYYAERCALCNWDPLANSGSHTAWQHKYRYSTVHFYTYELPGEAGDDE